jgi:catechol 2,3-dioxygenase-like lactoylglutathione lyase family enzyme
VPGSLGRLHHVVLDTEDPRALATFYSALLGLPVTYDDGDWVVVATSPEASGLAFQRVARHRRPSWPDPDAPQQVHLDVMVDDVASAGAVALALGARALDADGVFEDPAGHPFCLVVRPAWAPPIASPP